MSTLSFRGFLKCRLVNLKQKLNNNDSFFFFRAQTNKLCVLSDMWSYVFLTEHQTEIKNLQNKPEGKIASVLLCRVSQGRIESVCCVCWLSSSQEVN